MKYEKNRTTDRQKAWLDDLQQQGYKAVVCYGAGEAVREIKEYFGKWENMPCSYEGGGEEKAEITVKKYERGEKEYPYDRKIDRG